MYLENYAISPAVTFWERYAKWYDLWIKHNTFHNHVLEFLYKIVEPDFKVIDIGAGNGVLALPLISLGCDVTIIEPSDKMRDLLFQEAQKRQVHTLNVDPRRWEDIPILTYQNYDLVIACNSLHLMDMPFEMALNKVFSLGAKCILLVSELKDVKGKIKLSYEKYSLNLLRVFYADTSYAYHSLNEAYEHYEFRIARSLSDFEKNQVKRNLVFYNDHFWSKSNDLFGMYVWYRKF
ncbi:MAG: class I SAM-dependent methyltransferase [Proteobacteria bacterium]|nr:class I SAM-dependent methyltransferase [Pseudomonadota bacterium]